MTEYACDRKQVFKREDAARRELRRIKRKVIDNFRLQAYFCERHNGWHLGNVQLPYFFVRRRKTATSPETL